MPDNKQLKLVETTEIYGDCTAIYAIDVTTSRCNYTCFPGPSCGGIARNCAW